MGQFSFAATAVGFQLGMASYAFSINDSTSGKSELKSVSSWLPQLAPLVAIQFDPNAMHTEQDLVNARQQIAAQIGSKNTVVHDAYQLGLHIGLAAGQSTAPASAWAIASGLCARGIRQAIDDLHLSSMASLANIHYDKTLSDIAASINPQRHDPQITNRIVIPWNTVVRPAIEQQRSMP